MTERRPLTVLTSVDPVLRDSVAMGLVTDSTSTVVLRHDIVEDGMGGALRRLVLDGHGVVEDVTVPLEHACLSCAVREDAVPVLRRLAGDGRWDAVALALPVSAEPLPVVRALAGETERGGLLEHVRLAPVVAAVDLDTAVHDVLGDDLLTERDLALTADDLRSVGEALVAQLGHADLVLTTGDAASSRQASDLLDHLRAADGHRVDGLHELDVRRLLAGRHDVRTGELRLDPLSATPVLTVSSTGVWTIELSSARPFHPERLLEGVASLGEGRIRGRGVFWVANRPGSACGWDGVGGQLSVGDLEPWGPRVPFTRLVITGVDDDAPRLREAFDELLLSDAEMRRGLGAWLGREDVLEPWLGERSTT